MQTAGCSGMQNTMQAAVPAARISSVQQSCAGGGRRPQAPSGEAQRQAVKDALELCSYHRGRTAAYLGVDKEYSVEENEKIRH